MHDQAKKNGRVSLAVAGGIGVAGFLLGIVASYLTHSGSQAGAAPFAAVTKHATITLVDDNGTCTFTADHGSGPPVPYKFVVIKPHHGSKAGDHVIWNVVDGRQGHNPSVTWDLSFPSGNDPFSHSQPFGNGSGHSSDSGDSSSPAGDYAYEAINLVTDSGSKSCANARDPGVHVDP